MAVGTFAVDDAFYITGRGLVLTGSLSGEVSTGQHLLFPSGARYRIQAISHINRRNQIIGAGLLLETTITSRSEAAEHNFIGVAADIID